MSKVIVIAGYGPGISHATGKRFAKEGFKVALLSRTMSKLEHYAAELRELGAIAEPYACDVTDMEALQPLYKQIKEKLGPITHLLWNHFGSVPKPFLEQTSDDIMEQYKGVGAFVRTVQLLTPDMEMHKDSKPAIMLTGGGGSLAENDAVQQTLAHLGWQIPGSVAAAKRAMVASLRFTLEPKGIKVTEVLVTKIVIGTAFDSGDINGFPRISPDEVAEQHWRQATEETGKWTVTV